MSDIPFGLSFRVSGRRFFRPDPHPAGFRHFVYLRGMNRRNRFIRRSAPPSGRRVRTAASPRTSAGAVRIEEGGGAPPASSGHCGSPGADRFRRSDADRIAFQFGEGKIVEKLAVGSYGVELPPHGHQIGNGVRHPLGRTLRAPVNDQRCRKTAIDIRIGKGDRPRKIIRASDPIAQADGRLAVQFR